MNPKSLLSTMAVFITDERIFEHQDGLLVATSGGIDSVVMLDMLYKLSKTRRWRLVVGHIDHGFRGEASKKDAQFTKALAEKYNLPFRLETLAPKQFAGNGNKQALAREARYETFERWRKEEKLDFIVTAHHADDQAETLIHRLARGAGVSGLAGIRLVAGYIRRPMLFATKSQILEYAEKEGLSWQEDASNQSDKYTRNRIRHEILPALEALQPNARRNIAKAALVMQQTEELIDTTAKRTLQDHIVELIPTSYRFASMRIDISKTNSISKGLRLEVWRAALKMVLGEGILPNIRYEHLLAIDQLTLGNAKNLKSPLPAGLQVVKEGHYLVISKNDN